MPFEIVRNDIVNMQVDAIVNTANPRPVIGSGVDRAIHQKAGKKLLSARQEIGDIDFGDAVITPGFDLDAKYVIHTAGPLWEDGNHGESEILASCYRKSLNLAKVYQCQSIAFPLISTGNYGFLKSLALQIAIQEISTFLLENDMQVYLVVFENESFVLSEKLFNSVSSYIDENYVYSKTIDEYDSDHIDHVYLNSSRFRHYYQDQENIKLTSSLNDEGAFEINSFDLDEMLDHLDDSFSQMLIKLIDLSGKKDAEIYKKANIDRKLFSKIKNNINYRPSKTTALAFALALELDIDTTKDLIGRAGFALSHSSKFDVIVEYFLINRNYNVFELNEVLFAFDQPLIGA
ncbi:macro domain-containing protein [[Clostridium] spiroforme]|nr:macro domain-containing protein [Thomasclavelia spiroformis]MBM6880318.1 macro domain-containing protein [Thomasclavelia spiroformis]